MKLILSCSFILLTTCLSAQKKAGVVYRDTINLRGYIYNFDGTPMQGAVIESKQKDTIYNILPLFTKTNNNGYFELKGAKTNDTLSLNPFRNVYYNRGSRYMIIYRSHDDILLKKGIEINAIRKYPQLQAKFQIKNPKSLVIDDATENEADYPGGIDKFLQNIKSRIVYPNQAIKHNIEGNVEIEFTILKDGNLDNYKVLKGIGYGCDEAVVEALKNSSNWIPAHYLVYKIPMQLIIAIQFKLTD